MRVQQPEAQYLDDESSAVPRDSAGNVLDPRDAEGKRIWFFLQDDGTFVDADGDEVDDFGTEKESGKAFRLITTSNSQPVRSLAFLRACAPAFALGSCK